MTALGLLLGFTVTSLQAQPPGGPVNNAALNADAYSGRG
jgi:hypothetical protein